MIDITDEAVFRRYLADRHLVPADEEPQIAVLKGGVSCEVLRVETQEQAFVVKQARPKLRVSEDWFSDMRL